MISTTPPFPTIAAAAEGSKSPVLASINPEGLVDQTPPDGVALKLKGETVSQIEASISVISALTPAPPKSGKNILGNPYQESVPTA